MINQPHKQKSLLECIRAKPLEALTLTYLVIPYVIFIAGWLQVWIVTISMLIIAVGVRQVLKTDYPEVQERKFAKTNTLKLALAMLMLGFWVVVSGMGGFTPQTNDYNKHNAIIHDLTLYKWPVVYRSGHTLDYYTGYYLPAAVVGKVAGINAAHYFMLAWGTTGVLIVFLWLCRLVGKRAVWLALLLIGFSGMDIIGYLIFHHSLPPLSFNNLEWSSSPALGIWQYSANTTLLDWVPQHAIAGWLVTSVIVANFVERRSLRNLLFLYSLSWLMSPLVAVGLAPIMVGIAVHRREKWKQWLSFQNIICTGLLLIIMGLYFMSSTYKQPLGPIWQFVSLKHNLWRLFILYLTEFAIYGLVLFSYIRKKESSEWLWLYGVTMATLLLLPLVKYGLFNDLMMRASIPVLFVLMIMVARFLASDEHTGKRAALLLCLLIGCATPVYELSHHIKHSNVQTNRWVSIDNQQLSQVERDTANQYYGNRNSIFFKYLAKHN